MDDVPEDLFTKNGLQPLKSALKSAEDRLLVPLKKAFPSVRFSFDFARKAGLGYYQHLCYHIFAKTETGRRVQLADGGTVDWLAKLLASRKECMVTSGFGCELVQNKFSPTTDNPGR